MGFPDDKTRSGCAHGHREDGQPGSAVDDQQGDLNRQCQRDDDQDHPFQRSQMAEPPRRDGVCVRSVRPGLSWWWHLSMIPPQCAVEVLRLE